MRPTDVRLGLLFALCLFAVLWGLDARVCAQATELPDSLVLRFEEGAADLDQAAIRDALTAELRIPIALEGSEEAATLSIGRSPSGELRVSYRPAREELARSIPVTAKSDVPDLIAHLAGNLVRSEARELLAELTPAEPATPAVAVASTPAPAAASASPPPAKPAERSAEAPPYFDDAWIFSVLGGAALMDEDEQLQFTLQLSRRIGRFELAVSPRFGYGRADAWVLQDESSEEERVSTYNVTLPVSAEYRLLGRDEAYLQLGAYVGFRLAGIMNQSESVTSGSEGDFAFGLQATMGFRLARTHGVMLRFMWDLAPETHSVSGSDGQYEVDALAPVVQVGWQIGW